MADFQAKPISKKKPAKGKRIPEEQLAKYAAAVQNATQNSFPMGEERDVSNPTVSSGDELPTDPTKTEEVAKKRLIPPPEKVIDAETESHDRRNQKERRKRKVVKKKGAQGFF